MLTEIRRIGVLTGGGDAPGLNAVIRAVVKAASNSGIDCIGLEDSFDGLIETDRSRMLTPRDVTGILRFGGTILGTTNRGNPFAYPVQTSEGTHDYSDRVVHMFHKMGLDAVIVIGGDGTLAIAQQFCERGIPMVGVPKTIDNDIVGTTEGGADAILIPEIPFDIEIVAERLLARDRWGAKFSIVVVAEGAYPKGGAVSLIEAAHGAYVARLGGIGAQVCASLGAVTGKETRYVVLGHLQRGGAPTSFDRVLATRFGGKAVELVKCGQFGTMVAFDPPDIRARPLEEVVGKTKTVPKDFDLLLTAKALGVTFGDEQAERPVLRASARVEQV
ncbi:MAG: 6-phosphofructokinase [Acidobacteria bacterium]|nr:MAG: 6-phosphofructokinase [Acidobacteriota bacterium]